MDNTIFGLVGAASALALAGTAGVPNASAQPAPLPPAQSYAELLDPIPNAISRLRTQRGDGDLAEASDESPFKSAQYHHHHHHHHDWWGWRHRNHHHHHHHHHNHHHHYY